MSIKKLLWIFLLLFVVAVIVTIIISTNNINQIKKVGADDNKNLGNANKSNVINNEEIKLDNEYKKIELDDGILYTITGKKEQADMIIGTNYYDTTLTDIYYNPQNYMNKKIEIEGMYLLSSPDLPYTFVGRYSLNTMCPTCPAGYSVMEYQLQGKMDRELKDEEDWIKIIGTLEKGNDESSYYQDYYYLKVLNLEVMNEKGQTTVNN